MNKKLLILPISALMVFMMAGLVHGQPLDCNVSIPSIVNADTVLNATFNNTDGTIHNVSVFFEAKSVSTQNTSFSPIGNVSNTSLNPTSANITFGRDLIFQDANDYQFRVTCYLNGTGGANGLVTTSTVTGRVVDRSVPKCTYDSVLVSSDTYAPNQKWSLTCANFTSTPTIQFGSNAVKDLVVSSPARLNDVACTYTGDKQAVPQGTYKTLDARFTDGTNVTSCVLQSIRIDIGVPLKQVAAIIASQGGGKATTTATNGVNPILWIVIFGLAGLWYIRNKKGK